ncbi:hypothetical protein [Flavobacterium sp.]|uniref:hypothetical protein n=1 Tax=Flavobacterium sp. TaxID=239 RepID=UPI003D6C423C
MIAVNKELLNNSVLVDEAKNLRNSNFITKGQLDAILLKFPGLKQQHNFLIWIGFFLLGCILYSSIAGTLSLIAISGLSSNYEFLLFIYSLIGFVGCEILAKQNYYCYGLDDAFILGAQACLFCGIGVVFEQPIAVFISMVIVGLFCCLRYLNILSALISCIGIVGFFSDLIVEFEIIDKGFLPFVTLFLAAILYFLYAKLVKTAERYYKNSLLLIQAFALILGYLSMNYLVVRELSEELMNVVIAPGTDIPFAFLFYGLTFLIPISYIFYSLLKKDKLMLLIGFAALAFSFYTIRYYYSVLPLEIALILGGTLLSILAYFSIRKLKHKTSGVTFAQDRNANNAILSNVEAVIVNLQVNLKGMPATEQKMPFGGGDASGGGSGGSY